MRTREYISLALAACFGALEASSVLACSIEIEDRPASEVRAQSRPVAVDPQCRMINGGVYDYQTLGPVELLGDGRFYQKVNDRPHEVMLGDCNTREVTILRGPGTQVGESSCGPSFEYASLVDENAPFSLSRGSDLHELVAIAMETGAREFNPKERFFEFTTNLTNTHKVGPRDRFDLLCGCKRYYPDSPGAKL